MNLDPQTPEGARNRTLLKVVAGLAVAGVVIGLLTGLAGASALRAIGLDPDNPPPPDSVPSTTATSSPETSEPTETTRATEPTASQDDSKDKKNKKKDKDKKKPKLDATPKEVSPGERINLSGKFPKLDNGAVLQVQRLEDGSWDDFPVTVTSDGDGAFETWVVTSRTGKMKFRLKVQESKLATPAATVRIG